MLGTGIRETGDPVSKRGGDANNCWVVVALRLERSGTGAGLDRPRSSLAVTWYPGRAMGGTPVTTSGTSGRRGSVVGNGNNSFFEVTTDRDVAALFAAGDIPVDCADGERRRRIGACWARGDSCIEVFISAYGF